MNGNGLVFLLKKPLGWLATGLVTIIVAVHVHINLSAGRQQEEGETLLVNYDASIESLVAAGNYDQANPEITSKNFPPGRGEAGAKKVFWKLFCFDQTIKTKDAIDYMAAENYRPATAREILAFGVTYPDIQTKFPIVGLSASKDRGVVELWSYHHHRSLNLNWLDHWWDSHYRFLGIHK